MQQFSGCYSFTVSFTSHCSHSPITVYWSLVTDSLQRTSRVNAAPDVRSARCPEIYWNLELKLVTSMICISKTRNVTPRRSLTELSTVKRRFVTVSRTHTNDLRQRAQTCWPTECATNMLCLRFFLGLSGLSVLLSSINMLHFSGLATSAFCFQLPDTLSI